MLAKSLSVGAIVVAVPAVISGATAAERDLEGGAQAFQPCTVCHSLEPGKRRTRPNLAGIWGRKAGTAQDFSRYDRASVIFADPREISSSIEKCC